MQPRRVTVAALAVVLVGVVLVAGAGHHRAEVAAATHGSNVEVTNAGGGQETPGTVYLGDDGDDGRTQTTLTTRRRTPTTRHTQRPTTVSGAS